MHELILSLHRLSPAAAGFRDGLAAGQPRAAAGPAGPGRMAQTLDEHRAILAALERHDPEARGSRCATTCASS
jgi:DNA-binding GntR family transcriptional regulator